MKKNIVFVLINLCLSLITLSQQYTSGEKAEGGIIVYAEKKSGLVVSEMDLGEHSWDEGRRICNELSLNGYDDWRLPSLNEMKDIFYTLYLKKVGEYGTGFYWINKENTGIRTLAWCIDFKTGDLFNGHSKTNKKYILAVRTYKLPK
jgi:hypothetical protein